VGGQAGPKRAARAAIPFREVNARGTPGHDPALQRHHILPRQLLTRGCFGAMFETLGPERVGFEDFRINGMLLPASEAATRRTGMPLHRGPHRAYNEVVIERVGRIEEHWSSTRRSDPEQALLVALMRLHLLQAALRQRLLHERRRMILNRRDPLGTGFDFTELDAMAEALWAASGAPATPPPRLAPPMPGSSISLPAPLLLRDTRAQTGPPCPRRWPPT
jgi:hypothetical protein